MPDIHGLPFQTLLADQQAFRNVVRGVQHRQEQFDHSGLTTALLFFCVFFVAVWGVARVFVRSGGEATQKSSRALVSELCRAHRLTRRDWWFLTRLARHHRLTDPVFVFLDPRWLDPATCGPAWQRQAPRLRGLQLSLFAGLASPLPTSGVSEAKS